MKPFTFKQVLPHLAALVAFVLVAIIYCKPALEGKVLQQGDVIHWKGMSKDIQDYRDAHNGVAPLWTINMFGGMPGYQIATNNNNYVSYWANETFSLFIPKPFRFFILACLGFYFLALALRVNPWLAMMGALGYAYATYDSIIIAVGHDTKMLSIAYVPALLGALLLIFRKKYWIGAALTALFSSILIFHNHYQIVYYLLLVTTFMTAGHFYQWIRQKETKHLVLASVFALVAGLTGVFTNAVMLFTTYDYSKATIRGGQAALNLTDSLNKKTNNGGLDTAYAFLYGSYGMAETFTLLVPDMYGGASNPLGEDSKLVETMSEKGLPPQLANQLYSYVPSYWGKQPGHSGPVYLGAIFCFLFLFGMLFLKTHHKWWILAITILAILMSWGKNFATFNTFLFNYLPMYNKFRAPAMILIIPQLTFPLTSILILQEFVAGTYDRAYALKKLRIAAMVMAGIFLLLGFLYVSFDYKAGFERDLQQQLNQISPGDPNLGKDIINAVVADRKNMFGGDLIRSLFFVAAAIGMLFFYLKGSLKQGILIASLIILNAIDLLGVGKRYLNENNFLEPEDFESVFQPTPADLAIKKDPEKNYRVLNLTQSPFNDAITSYHHQSVGGYHAAKLSIYQDLIENQLSRQPMNEQVLNMLNTKYIIAADSTGQPVPQVNPAALGSTWLVREIRYVPDARAEMQALNNFNPAQTAIVEEAYKASITVTPQWDSAARIALMENDHDRVTYTCESATPQFAVFSEVFYDRGWKAFIDGTESPIVRTNYVLRGLAIPAGKHNIEFRFEPHSYSLGRTVTNICQLILLILLAGGLFLEFKKKEKST